MKIRNGFVSNSSSSSFIIITTKEEFNKILKMFDKKERKFIKAFFEGMISKNILGKKRLYLCSEYSSDHMMDVASDLELVGCGDEEHLFELLYDFETFLNKEPDSFIEIKGY